MPRTLSDDLVRKVPVIPASDSVGQAARRVVDSGLPALPVDDDGRYCGIFGEREFVTVIFPGYLGELKYAGFMTHALDEGIEKRATALAERVGDHCNREHIDVDEGFSDAQLAEIFLHHRVLIVPVVDSDRHVKGVITRGDFFAALVDRIDGTE
ncbi:MAG: CBS domain-containing protein [Thermoleophilaceae bacterium]